MDVMGGIGGQSVEFLQKLGALCKRRIEDQSRLLDFVPKSSKRATNKTKRALVKGVKEALSCLAVGAAEITA